MTPANQELIEDLLQALERSAQYLIIQLYDDKNSPHLKDIARKDLDFIRSAIAKAKGEEKCST
jgi:hypothetical protein